MGTRGQWASDFLRALGNENPSEDALKFVAAWTSAEGTAAQYNPLATTLDHGPNTPFNHLPGGGSVKNYATRQQGIDASVITLRGNFFGYARLREGLQINNVQEALTSGGLDTWGSGSAHVGTIYAARDVRGEALRSEPSGERPDQPPQRRETPDPGPHQVPNAPVPPGVPPGVHKPPINSGGIHPTQPHIGTGTGNITADTVKAIGKVVLGIALLGFGLMIIAVSLITGEKATQAIKVVNPMAGKALQTAAAIK